MLTKKILVASRDTKKFVEAILYLGSLGATIPDGKGVFKGVRMRATLEVDEETYVQEDSVIKVVPPSKEEVKASIEEKKKERQKKDSPAKKKVEKKAKEDSNGNGEATK